MQEYIRRWNGKHPIPYDFFNTFNNYLGKDLSWYWKPWFFEFGYPDLAIKSYNKKDCFVEVEVERKGNIPIPVKILLINDGEEVKEIYRTAEVWKNEDRILNIRIENPPPFNLIILGDVQIPDVYKRDNEIILKK
jgi:aminopeptidase N